MIALYIILALLGGVYIFDKWIQTRNLIIGNFPIIGRMRYFFHELRPFFRQYFGDDNAFVNRIVIDWIIAVSNSKTGYFSYDKFDTTQSLHNGAHQMIHSNTPLNQDETNPQYPIIGEKRKHPLQLKSFFYRSAMSLGALSFEATTAMAKGCANAGAAFNTGEGGLSIHHLPNLKFSFSKKFLKYKKVPKWTKAIYYGTPTPHLKTYVLDILGNMVCRKDYRDLYLFDKKNWLFYTINWEAPLKAFPKPEDLTEEYGDIILQIGSALYGLRGESSKEKIELDWERFKKTTSFCKAIEVKLAQGAKQTGGILKKNKNTPSIASIRGITPDKDLQSPNRFPFYEPGKEEKFFTFLEKMSKEAEGKPVGVKIVISDESNIVPLAKQIAKTPKKAPDFITIDGGDGGTGAAPIALSVLYGKKIYEALEIANQVLIKHKVRDKVKIFAASKLYAPHMSAKALALGADAIGNARSIMIAGGCIRAGVCSGENGTCPVGMATMKKSNRRIYAQTLEHKANQIKNYITAHNKGIIQVAAVAGLTSPSLLTKKHIAKPSVPVRL